VSQYERCLVLDIEVIGEGEHALALHLITKKATAMRWVWSGSLCQAYRVFDATEKSALHAL
jgi:hypothetical protein